MSVVDETDLELVRGDSEDFLITVADEDGDAVNLGAAVDGTAARPAIVRMGVFEDADDPNSLAIFIKRSYSASEIVLLDQVGATLGQVLVYVDKPDTQDVDEDDYPWDCECTLQDFLRTVAGTITIGATTTITGDGTDFTLAKAGDVLQPLSGGNTKPVLITRVVSATEIEVEAVGHLTAGAGISFEIRRGRSRTIARGTFSILKDKVKTQTT